MQSLACLSLHHQTEDVCLANWLNLAGANESLGVLRELLISAHIVYTGQTQLDIPIIDSSPGDHLIAQVTARYLEFFFGSKLWISNSQFQTLEPKKIPLNITPSSTAEFHEATRTFAACLNREAIL